MLRNCKKIFVVYFFATSAPLQLVVVVVVRCVCIDGYSECRTRAAIPAFLSLLQSACPYTPIVLQLELKTNLLPTQTPKHFQLHKFDFTSAHTRLKCAFCVSKCTQKSPYYQPVFHGSCLRPSRVARKHRIARQTTNQHKLTSNVGVRVNAADVPLALTPPVQQRHGRTTTRPGCRENAKTVLSRRQRSRYPHINKRLHSARHQLVGDLPRTCCTDRRAHHQLLRQLAQ